MYSEDDLLPVAAIQHIVFCERQCALMYIEGVWAENRLTVTGGQLHERVHAQAAESRGDLHVARAVALHSFRLGLSGIADVVEFHRQPSGTSDSPNVDRDPDSAIRTSQSEISLPGLSGLWRPFPVEYKRGRPKRGRCDEAQLCAQALCLEEMLNVAVPRGALFYGKIRRRREVAFDAALRGLTEEAARRLHQLVAERQTPDAVRERKCRRCSLLDFCLPRASPARSASRYLAEMLAPEEAGRRQRPPRERNGP